MPTIHNWFINHLVSATSALPKRPHVVAGDAAIFPNYPGRGAIFSSYHCIESAYQGLRFVLFDVPVIPLLLAVLLGVVWARICCWDWYFQQIPNRLNLVSIMLVFMLVAWTHQWWALLGGILWATLYALVYYLSKGLGAGDVKFAPSCGMLCALAGISSLFLAVLLAQLLAVLSFMLAKFCDVPPRQAGAHGPHMVIASLITLLLLGWIQ